MKTRAWIKRCIVISLKLRQLIVGLALWGAFASTLASSSTESELRFDDFFNYPVGPAGLTFSEKLKSLEGKQVCLSGYIVQEDHRRPDGFLLAPLPLALHQDHYGLADDLPPGTVYVSGAAAPLRTRGGKPLPVALAGVLHLRNREEGDGRISLVRLTLSRAPVTIGEASKPRPSIRKGAESLSSSSRGQLNQKSSKLCDTK